MEIQFCDCSFRKCRVFVSQCKWNVCGCQRPINRIVSGEDDFRLVEPDSSLTRKEYEFRGERFYLMPQFYGNGWLALTLQKCGR